MATICTPPTCDCECLQRNIDELAARDEIINARLCAVEDVVEVKPFSPGTIGFASDTGEANGDQSQVANLVQSWGLGDGTCFLDGLVLGGDNNYPDGADGTFDANMAAFAALEAQGLIFPALGNHERDTNSIGENTMTRFPSLFVDDAGAASQRGYYHKYIENGDIDLYVLNDGMDTGYFTDPAPPFDGNSVGSQQYQWLVNQLAANTGRWRIVAFHHPFVTSVGEGDWPPRYLTSMDWNFKALGIHLCLTGHTHTNSHIRSNGLDCLDISCTAITSRDLGLAWFGGSTAGAYNVWQDLDGAGNTSLPAVAKIIAEKNFLKVEVYRASDGSIIHSFVV